MGYGAFVVCECYQKGKTIKPPYEEHVVFDECGLHIRVPETIYQNDRAQAEEMELQFDEWKTNACEHDYMAIADEFFGTARGLGDFYDAVKQADGAKLYPVLLRFIGMYDESLTVKQASIALEELLRLKKANASQQRISLYEKISNTLLANSSVNITDACNYTDADKYILNNNEFCIVKKDKKVFCSTNFTQTKISQNKFRFTDVETKKTYVARKAVYESELDKQQTRSFMDRIFQRNNNFETYEFNVRNDSVKINTEFDEMIESCELLLQASIQTGNPIHWY